MSHAHLRDIYLEGTQSGPSFKGIDDLHITNLTFRGGEQPGKAMEVEGQQKPSIEAVVKFIEENLHSLPETERKKISNAIDELDTKVGSAVDAEKPGLVSKALKGIYDIAVGAGGSVLSQYLAPFVGTAP